MKENQKAKGKQQKAKIWHLRSAMPKRFGFRIPVLTFAFCLLPFAFAWLTAYGQPPTAASNRKSGEEGLPFVTWFSPETYQGSSQVFSVEQDDRGLIYLGTNAGVREYDGSSWRTIQTPHNGIVRGLAKGADGHIYVGEVGDIGYLQPDTHGTMQYVSLLEFVPPEDRNFQDVTRVIVTPEGIYFQPREILMRLTREGNGWRYKSWKPTQAFSQPYYVYGTLYVRTSEGGIYQMVGDVLQSLTLRGPFIQANTRLTLMLPYSDATGEMLLGTRTGDMFVLDGENLRPFVSEAASLLRQLGIIRAGVLRDGAYGIVTATGGLLILERNGKMRRYLDRSAGILSDGGHYILVDRVGTVWLALQNGVAKVETMSPLTEFSRALGMSGSITEIVRYRGELYVATTNGLQRLDATTRQFQRVAEVKDPENFGLLVHGDTLLVATAADGIYQFNDKRLTGLFRFPKPSTSAYSMAPSVQDANRVWVCTSDGLAAIRKDAAGRWVYDGIIENLPVLRSLVETEPGVLWVGTEARGVLRIRLQGNSLLNPKIEYFTSANGLPDDSGVSVHKAAGRILFANRAGVREFDEASGRFVESKLFGAIPTGGSSEEYTVRTNSKGDIWVNFGARPVLMRRQGDGSYQMDNRLLGRINNGQVSWLHVDDDDVLWMGGLDRVMRYDPALASSDSKTVQTLVRNVTAGESATLLYGGGGTAIQMNTPVPYVNNTLRFEYSVASLEDPARNQFQTRLEGFDHDWSAWTRETRRDYTNLPPGSYRFRVKSVNALGQAGAEAEYRLTILPPWYRTWWAYGTYALSLAGLGYVVSRIQRRRVVTREREKSALREAQLRAETAAAQAKTLEAEAKTLAAENERNKNVELLSEIGKELTSSLDLDTIFFRLYEHVNQLMDATIFGVGVYYPDRQEIEYRLAMEKGKRFAPYTRDTRDRNQFPVWCIEHRQPVFINNVATEYSQYIEHYEESLRHLEDGATSTAPSSMIYLPLMMKEKVLGVITVQSYKQNAYSNHHLDLLENLAAYTSIALDNADAYQHLKATQDQLVVQEKLASLGALTAGIAHEIKNPLNFVNNFADLSVELMTELREDITKHKAALPADDFANIQDLLDDLTANAKKINEHGKRADGIVRSMLLHSRGQAGERQPTDINAMLEEYVNLTYHGMRAQDSSFNVTIERELASDTGTVEAIPQDLSRVFLNLLNNACYAVNDRAKKNGGGYVPKLRVESRNLGETVEIRIRDNGLGIPADVREKIFNPFFTTKPTGQGTGLGLSISHDIVVQQHGGQLEVETEPGEFTEFIVRLPRKRA